MNRLVFYFSFLLLAALPVAAESAAAEGYFQEALHAVAVKDPGAALGKFEAALALDPDNTRFASAYRQAVIDVKQYDRCLSFFEKLVAGSPQAANAYLNYGFAYVDKIPDAGSITQVILANNALSHFSKSIELRPTWIGYYTRGNSYLFWPRIFNRTQLGIDDLEAALKMQKGDRKRSYHARVYVALGDGYWKIDDLTKARSVWREGLAQFPDNQPLKARLDREGDALKALIGDAYDPNKRVNTDLQELWTN